MNKKAFTLIELIAVVAILGLIASIVMPAVSSIIRSTRDKAYNSQIEIIIKAAKAWGVEHVNELPDEGGQPFSLQLSSLTSEGYISSDDIIDPRNKKKNLSGYVEIKYESNQYTYTYKENAQTKSLSKSIISKSKKSSILTLQNGIYKGKDVNNYLKFDDMLWRIISVNADGTIKIVSDNKIANLPFDTNGGFSFENSSINNYLNNDFYSNLVNSSLVVSNKYCLGFQDECNSNLVAKVSLLSASDFINASDNLKCISGGEEECMGSNYLATYSTINGPEYTLTTINNKVFIISNGKLDGNNFNSTSLLNVRPVITLGSNARVTAGDGSIDNPYEIR